MINETHKKVYDSVKHLFLDEIIIKFKCHVAFKEKKKKKKNAMWNKTV